MFALHLSSLPLYSSSWQLSHNIVFVETINQWNWQQSCCFALLGSDCTDGFRHNCVSGELRVGGVEGGRQEVRNRREREGCCRLWDTLTHRGVTAAGWEQNVPLWEISVAFWIINAAQKGFSLLRFVIAQWLRGRTTSVHRGGQRQRAAWNRRKDRRCVSAPWTATMAPVLEDAAGHGEFSPHPELPSLTDLNLGILT